MKSRYFKKSKRIAEAIAEKCMECIYSIYYWCKRRKGYKSKLIEEYSIKQQFRNEPFVRNFLDDRQKVIELNRYRMNIKEENTDDGNENVIGRVRLLRNNTFIHEAKLITKEGDESKIIYWCFE